MSLLPNVNLIADSLGWAVLHSLWQGVVAAGIVYTVRNLTRERASEARYFTGILTLCALLCAFIGTFLYYYNAGAAISGAANTDIMQTITIGFSETASTGNPLMRLGDFTGLIGIFWTVCFAVLGIRYMTAFRLTHKLRTTGLSVLPSNWQTRFTALAAKSGVSGKVRAYVSEHVSSPITFGFFKPIVLVPTWFFTGMTPEQCEAVLLHELAHIRRHDYLTNILQIAIKTVFFYHPAVQFICKGLDTDREHACDDFAVMLTKNPESLATALGTIRLKAARDGGVFALSASGSADGHDAPLMGRLKRLMGAPSKSLRKGTSRGLAAAAMMSSALALVMVLGATTSEAHPQKNQIEIPDWEKLAGAGPADDKPQEKKYNRMVVVNGETYQAGEDEINALNNITIIGDGKGKTSHIINGKKYPSKYTYSIFSKDGKSYVVKQKNGKRYMEIGNNWFLADSITPTPPAAPPTPATPRVSSSKNYWVSDQVAAANEARAERASEQREAALERAAEARERVRERGMERAEDLREAALERAAEEREASLERNEEHRIRNYERQIAKMERKIASKERGFSRDEASREQDIRRLERGIAKKQADFERKIENSANISPGELGRMQGEIGRLHGEIGRIQGKKGYGQGELGRLQGELGRMQGEIGRIQGEWGHRETAKEQKKYYKMRDKLIPLLKADGFMKTNNSKVTIKMTPTDIFINGRKLANAQEDQYCDIVSKYISRKGDVKKIVIKPGYLHISQKKNGHTSSFTHNEN